MNLFESRPIVLIDDSTSDIELIEDAVARYKMEPQLVILRDGAEAMEYLFGPIPTNRAAMWPPCLVLLDKQMPKISGMELARRIKADPELKMIPVVMFTGEHDQADLKECYQIGINAYVVKPTKYEEYREVVRDLIRFWSTVNVTPRMRHTRLAHSEERP